ncbi:MAG: asparaginase [Dysosmobacter sp.]
MIRSVSTFARSSAKPLQAIPVAESGALEHYGITPQELAVICSSHNGEPFHVKAVESILHKAGLSPDQLSLRVGIPHVCPPPRTP